MRVTSHTRPRSSARTHATNTKRKRNPSREGRTKPNQCGPM
jgi:hypothetical protein